MSQTPVTPTAVLVSVELSGVTAAEHAADLTELERLVTTLGYRVVATVTQRRDSLSGAAVIGEGKLKELGEITGGKGVVPSGATPRKSKARERFVDGGQPSPETPREEWDEDERGERPRLVVVDHEITPSQARNLERATGAAVLDRTGVIVEIFHRHARSREARLQVEIARLSYAAPRMRESPNSERQAGRGAGESALELDRRKIRDRIAELREELAAIQKRDENRRKGREGQLRVALVGYTNAGKSSLMRALTGSEVLVEDKLFATLDTTVRALLPETTPRILVSDTVGFIKKLPHDLVASFKSTLDEALEASLLLYVVDASDPTRDSQLQVTRDVLREIGAEDVPSRVVLSKCDRLSPMEVEELRGEYPEALLVSSRRREDVEALHAAIVGFFDESMQEVDLVVPYDRQRLVAEIHAEARVLSETYDERGACLRVRALPATLTRLGQRLGAP